MSGGDLVLAASDALARQLRADFAVARRGAGDTVWRTPRILSLSQWIVDTWAETWPAEQVISGTQALALWLEAVEQDERPLLSSLACAREALRAERRALEYGLDAATLPAYTEEQQAWQRWRRRVRARLKRQRWLLREDLLALAIQAVRDGQWPLPARVVLHGFDLPQTPVTTALLAAMRERCHVESADDRGPLCPVIPHRCADDEAQFRHVGAVIAERLRNAESPPRILVVLPDPEGRRDRLEAALTDWVAPWRRRAGDPRGTPWRWDNGPPLAQGAWIDAAEAVFAIDLEDNAPEAVSRLLLSPPLWLHARAAAAALDHRLRALGRPRLCLDTVIANAPDAVAPALTALLETLRAAPRRAMPSTWAAHLQARLDAVAWPGDAALPSAVFQSIRELRDRLARLGAMDGVLGSIDLGRARMWLRELLRAGFEPRVEHEQPVLIADLDAALALPCDLLIICDASSDALPGRATASPFLALDAQRTAGMPEASPEIHLDHVRDKIAALRSRTHELRVLVPATDARGADLLPSPLFGHDWPALTSPPIPGELDMMASAPSPLQWPPADAAPAVSPAEQVRGDASLFSAWFESPFFALCTHRLGIERLPQPGFGLDPRVQGNALHAALETLWAQLGDQRHLRRLDDDALDDLITEALRIPLAKLMPEREIGRVLARLERQRLHDVLRQWLLHERRRVDPFTVELREAPLETMLEDLPLRLRVDRVDRVDSALGDRWLVLDYKTGRDADPRGWDEDRLHDPQLPLYATLAAQLQLGVPRVDGIGFAHLKDGHPALSAATDWCGSLIEPDTQPKRDWNERLAAWRLRLEAAARGFVAGDASVSASLPGTLRHDWLLPLAGDVILGDEDATS